MNAAEIDEFLRELDLEDLRDPLLPARIMVRWDLPPAEAEKVRRRILARGRMLSPLITTERGITGGSTTD